MILAWACLCLSFMIISSLNCINIDQKYWLTFLNPELFKKIDFSCTFTRPGWVFNGHCWGTVIVIKLKQSSKSKRISCQIPLHHLLASYNMNKYSFSRPTSKKVGFFRSTVQNGRCQRDRTMNMDWVVLSTFAGLLQIEWFGLHISWSIWFIVFWSMEGLWWVWVCNCVCHSVRCV